MNIGAGLILLVALFWFATIELSRTEGGRGQTDEKFLIGGDISALAKMEGLGAVYRDGGLKQDAIQIMRRYGANCFRLRIFVNPTGEGFVVNDLAYTIALAKRIKSSGAKFLLNFHYSDTWADPKQQIKPKAWSDLTFNELVEQVENYTRDCLQAMKREGILPDFVQPGNEITGGFLWDDGRLDGSEVQWEKFVKLLSSAIKAIRETSPQAKVIVHIDRGGDWQATHWFFENLERRKVDYDIIGLSYYPFWHGSIERLKENLNRTAKRFRKPIFIVETAAPNRPTWLPSEIKWEQSPQGQLDFLRELVKVVKETPDGLGIGVLWWFPESVPVPTAKVWWGGAMALFDEKGEPLPALKAFSEFGS
ncbi:MAG: arabinogalactan endo-1,4-beta-galactosidase [Armatimonadetes bacterium]|nr:arabinogalactan endo-1,4-beta-galactosidase [Armatimonadota bacterium]